MNKEVVKTSKLSNKLGKKTPDATTLIPINQYNTEKQNLEKKNWRCW